MNHYATEMFDNEGGRHYWFSKYLQEKGNNTSIFCANTFHNSKKIIDTDGKKYLVKHKNEIPFVFVRTVPATGNGIKRLYNMGVFYKNLFVAANNYVKENGKPDVIIASSVHPLTLIAGEKIARKLNIPCICEIRDLWPESLIEYGYLRRNSIISKVLYSGERYIYKNADSLIFTVPGAKQYIIDRKRQDQVKLDKVHYINNGVDLSEFNYNATKYTLVDEDLLDGSKLNIIYTGSIRPVNDIGFILDCAKELLNNQKFKNIRFLIYGDGNEMNSLVQRTVSEGIKNVVFKGKINKKYIPFVLKNSWINLLHNKETGISRYGTSQNKLFEYLASGKCLVQTMKSNYSICEDNNCGVVMKNQTVDEFIMILNKIFNREINIDEIERNAMEVAKNYDFKNHTEKLLEIINQVIEDK